MMNLPLLETERLLLSPPVADDFAATMRIVSDPETARFLGRNGTIADHFMRFSRSAGSWMLYGYGTFIVRLKDSGEVIGNCGVFHTFRGLGEDFDDQPEAGWILRSDQVGRGIASEAMAAALEWFDRAHARRIVCLIEKSNGPSISLAGKLGFKPLREAIMPEGAAVNLLERMPGRTEPG